MPLRIEDYAMIGDCHSVALVGLDGSIDWLCLPRFDSEACFAALLGEPENGRWQIAPASRIRSTKRHYHDGTLVLETLFEAEEGEVALIDFMPVRDKTPNLVRIVEGRRGTVPMKMELAIRFDYGSVVPWVQRAKGGLQAIAGPNALRLWSEAPLRGERLTTVSEFPVAKGQQVAFHVSWHRSYDSEPQAIDPRRSLKGTLGWWREWSKRCVYRGEYRDQVLRSLITLKALTYRPSGGIVAAATTSLPEKLGGVRNWDYRYCWLRDATLSLLALLNAGYTEEARAWRDWLLRAVAGNPGELQIMYGIGGERRLEEYETPWLGGYEGAKPVRIGNAAHRQFQLDVYGEVAGALHHARIAGLKSAEAGWNLQRALTNFVETDWDQPDEGLWEVRGPRRHFTHSKVMAWAALDRAILSAERFHLDAPLDRWRKVRDEIHHRVCREGFNDRLNSFVQSFGTDLLDASLLMIPLVGFLPASDPRVRGTIAAIEKHLMFHGLVMRYDTTKSADGLPPGEGAFLPCTFWLAGCYSLLGEREKGREIFERLIALCNDVGLLSEEYDPVAMRLVGNFPQAFSHLGLVNAALDLASPDEGPVFQRSRQTKRPLE